ncbi:glycosyltransferase [Cellulophaga geojensis KL-A]|uniref:Glycosyltransferase n=1 Tax=Cellulophaga geojensis KL-A TaxID=1328323 RepID=A0ABP3BA21_9FLAO|nr:glycosyltransferase [Cellulophaga geojensis]EWH14665.1 glycosyltransferase [Cellulophaga geojensis KL-A]
MKNVLFIGFVWPEPTTTAAGSRILQLITYFKQQNYTVTFASTAAKSVYSVDFSSLGVSEKQIQLNNASFNDFISDLNPNIVVFDRFLTEEQFGWRVAQVVPNALRILDTEDLHFLRKTREEAFKKGNSTVTETLLKEQEITKREIASIYRCDFSLLISMYEEQLLINTFKIDSSLFLHIPFMLNTSVSTNFPLFKNRKDFVCIGNGKHKPNVDAVLWLHKEIWPLIRKELPEVNLHIYGAYLPQQITEKHNPKTGFLVHGWGENVNQIMQQTKVNLAPLRFGAGIKGKLVDAMCNGTPSVTTQIGAEGMHGDLPWSGEISTTVNSFVASAISLYTNETKWLQAQKNGEQILNTYYAKSKLEDKLSNKISTLQKDIKKHRNTNFIGSLLQHHSMMSTKYLSKWIAEKEKKNEA